MESPSGIHDKKFLLIRESKDNGNEILGTKWRKLKTDKMTQEFVTGLAGQAIELTLLLSMPMLGTGLAVGLIVSIFQAVTQIQEMTLTFVPKIIAVLLALLFSFPWMMNKIIDFTRNLMEQIPVFIR